MYLNRVKNFIITFLMILAVYQTAGLWFEDFSGHSLFYSAFSDNSSNSLKEIKYNLESIIINRGNNEFIKKSNNIYNSSYKSVFDNAIKTALKSGSFKASNKTDWINELSSKCIIYNFSYTMENTQLKSLYNAKASIYSRIGDFNIIIITPNINIPKSMNVSFINTSKNLTYSIELKNNDIISKTYNEMTYLTSEEDDIYYISSIQNGFELFDTNIFLPKWNDAIVEYPCITMTNPMEGDGGVLLMTLEKNINHFFDNPAVKWTSTVNNIYTYSDESTVVKYYTTGVLEYSNYKSGGSSKADFSKDYLTALNFLNNDINIKNEYYLRSFDKDSDKIVFYFNYKINNQSILLSTETKEKTGMKSIIEVTVSDSKVIRYKRLVYDFSSKSNVQYETADIDFLSAIDKVYEENPQLEAEHRNIERIELCYNADKYNADNTENKISLSWFIQINGNVYVVDAKNDD